MKQALTVALVLAVILALGLLLTLSAKDGATEALGAVLVGAGCGIAAGIPTSILLLMALANRERAASLARRVRYHPPVILSPEWPQVGSGEGKPAEVIEGRWTISERQ